MEIDSHYIKMAVTTFLIALLIYLFMLIIFMFLKINMPQFLHVTVSVLGAGYLVYKFMADRLY